MRIAESHPAATNPMGELVQPGSVFTQTVSGKTGNGDRMLRHELSGVHLRAEWVYGEAAQRSARRVSVGQFVACGEHVLQRPLPDLPTRCGNRLEVIAHLIEMEGVVTQEAAHLVLRSPAGMQFDQE